MSKTSMPGVEVREIDLPPMGATLDALEQSWCETYRTETRRQLIAFAGAVVADVRKQDEAVMRQMRQALEGVVAWDRRRELPMPCTVRDPIYIAIAAHKHLSTAATAGGR